MPALIAKEISLRIHGVLAYAASQRVPEIGDRMALGASPGEVKWLVLRQSLAVILIGIAVGTFAAFAGVEGMRPIEPSPFAAMIFALVGAAFSASLLPARRASKIDPMKALRQE